MAIAGKSVPSLIVEWRDKDRKDIRIVHAQNVLDYAVVDNVLDILAMPEMEKTNRKFVFIRSKDAERLREQGYIVRPDYGY